MSRRSVTEIYDVSEAYEKVNLETLRPLAKFISPDAPTRKMDIVPFLIRTMTMKTWSASFMTSLAKYPKPRSRKPSPIHWECSMSIASRRNTARCPTKEPETLRPG